MKQRFLIWLTFLFVGMASLQAQEYSLNGTVLDPAGEPVIGARLEYRQRKIYGAHQFLAQHFETTSLLW